jgi:hypothetical protein
MLLPDADAASEALRIGASQIESRESKADVAQLVEQPIRNRQVTGSSPVVGSRTRCSAACPPYPFQKRSLRTRFVPVYPPKIVLMDLFDQKVDLIIGT